ncbi:hypothetical protein COHA_009022 [Chlorella ohadii]|uniref:Uncharacterized protein n=1 Tax=Chlorella ohadii TaxID=2649997 RepID=A0AAD5DFL9_9CHLO|nr:hypothetical protein COHA_009022 [Chlorella ohadii]
MMATCLAAQRRPAPLSAARRPASASPRLTKNLHGPGGFVWGDETPARRASVVAAAAPPRRQPAAPTARQQPASQSLGARMSGLEGAVRTGFDNNNTQFKAVNEKLKKIDERLDKIEATLAPSIWKVLKFLGLASMWLAAVSGGVGVLLMATRSGV